MTTNLERIEYELKLAGYKLEPIDENDPSDEIYVQRIGNCVYEICKLFAEQGYSGTNFRKYIGNIYYKYNIEVKNENMEC